MCSSCGIWFHIHSAFCSWLRHVERALESAPLCGRSQAATGAPPTDLATFGQCSRVPGTGRNHQMVEKSLLHSGDPMHVSGAELQTKGRGWGPAAALSAHRPSGSVGQKPSDQRGPHAAAMWSTGPCQQMRPWAWRRVKSCAAK